MRAACPGRSSGSRLRGEPAPVGWDLRRLSHRQYACIRLAAAGLSNPEIGEQLGIAKDTVRHHRDAAHRRIGVGVLGVDGRRRKTKGHLASLLVGMTEAGMGPAAIVARLRELGVLETEET